MFLLAETFFLSDVQVWSSGGTASNTTLLHDFNLSGSVASTLVSVTVSGEMHLLVGTSSGTQSAVQLWQSNGTTAGTTLVNFAAGTGVLVVGQGWSLSVYFSNDTSTQLWASDGTAAGTKLVYTDTATGNFESVATLNGRIFFAVVDPATGDVQFWAASI